MEEKEKNGQKEIQFNPEKYGMAICPYCNGKGSSLKDPDSLIVCTKCGGFGFVRKEADKNGGN